MDLLREDRAHHNQRTWEIKQSPSLQQVSHGEGVEGREAGSCASSRTRRSRQERNRNPYLIEWICSLYIEEETRRWTRADHYLERALGKKERKNAFFWPAELFNKLADFKRVERGWGAVSSLLVEVSRCSVVEVGIKDRRGRKGGVEVAEQEGCSCAIQDGWTQRRWTASLWDKMFFLCMLRSWALWQPPTEMCHLPGEKTVPVLAQEIGSSFSVSFSVLDYLLNASLWCYVGKYIKNCKILGYIWLELYI